MTSPLIHPEMLVIVNQLLPSFEYLTALKESVGVTSGNCLTPSIIQRISHETGVNQELMPEAVSFLDTLCGMELFYRNPPIETPLVGLIAHQVVSTRVCADPSKLLNAEQAGEFFVSDASAALQLVLSNHVVHALLVYSVLRSLVGRV